MSVDILAYIEDCRRRRKLLLDANTAVINWYYRARRWSIDKFYKWCDP